MAGTAPDLFGMPASGPEPPKGSARQGSGAGRRRGTNPGSRKRWVIVAGGVVVVLGAAGGGFWVTRGSSAPTPAYRLVAAESSTLRQTVSSSGTIEPAQRANLNFAASGQVTAVAVTVGKKVKAGQVLATVNSASLAANVAQAKASQALDVAKLAADQAAGSGATAAQLTADKAAVTAAGNQVTDAEQALAEARLTSPISGVVAALNLSVGQQVPGGSGSSGSGGSPNAQVVVISTTSYVVHGTVDDTQVGLVHNGDQAVIIPDGATTPVYGTVRSVGLIAGTSSGVATYPVTIAVTGDPGGLYPGASATVTLIVRRLSDVTTVPTAAVHDTSSGTVVDEIANGHQVAHPVTVGMTAGTRTQIVSGLSVGTEVVVPVPRTGGGQSTGGTTRRGGGPGGG